VKQLAQKLKDGSMQIIDVPHPLVGAGSVLVRNLFSLISAGTEGSTVKTARMGYLGKARERPQQVKQVIDTLKSQGVAQTYRAVMKKLDAYSPLGYSSAGRVLGVGSGVSGFVPGDPVACGGLTASHAEVVSVPANLCVKLHPDADLKAAAYNTLGAIALQGVRQAELHLGETCAVIGMGLLGQLTGLLLHASGVRVVAVDVDPFTTELAAGHCADIAMTREDPGIEGRILEFTRGLGCDAVIITAASSSLDPINFAGAVCRKRGTIVVVGAVPTGFDREPHFYKKELQVRMSCSYGPGRYDPGYEEKGIDYPPAYVRWTEKRNMESFQELLRAKSIDVNYLTTHVFKLAEAPAAYDMLLGRQERFVGILIEYDPAAAEASGSKVVLKNNVGRSAEPRVSIGFIGAGSYAQSHLLPNLPKGPEVRLKGVMTATGTGSRSVADRFGFEFCTNDEGDILGDRDINTVFIATRHDSHAAYVVKALEAGKHVFIEKPLCLTGDELEEVARHYTALAAKGSPVSLMVGYNRRFSPLAEMMKKELGEGPRAMTYRVNAGSIPADSWIQDQESGGGRIIGEVCHFVDLLTFLNGSPPASVYAAAMRSAGSLNDTVTISLSYANGSIGSISYFANGDKSLPKERVEVFCNGVAAVLDDFRLLSLYAKGRRKEKKLMTQDKGQRPEVRGFIESVLQGREAPIPFEDLCSTSLVTLQAVESIRSGERLECGAGGLLRAL
jgi:polar amino acid transport system substrate-binding protein